LSITAKNVKMNEVLEADESRVPRPADMRIGHREIDARTERPGDQQQQEQRTR
jgi:hypothetical protein